MKAQGIATHQPVVWISTYSIGHCQRRRRHHRLTRGIKVKALVPEMLTIHMRVRRSQSVSQEFVPSLVERTL